MKQTINQTTGAVDTTTVSNAIRTSYNLVAQPRLRADWNLNRYVVPTSDNVPAEATRAYEASIFPVSSLITPNRPNKGAPKAIIGQSVVAARYQTSLDARFYIGDDTDLYKYWISPDKTNGTGTFPLHTDGQTTCRPYVLYPSVLQANKIVLRIENTWATPKTFRVQIRTAVSSGAITTGWTTVATSPAIANDGTITLYYNGTSWSLTRPSTLVTTAVAGIMLAVDAMGGGIKRDGTATTYQKRTGTTGAFSQYTTDGSNSQCSVIAIEAHFEADLTSRLESVNDTFDLGDVSQLYPIGASTTNVGTITLDNGDVLFNNENSSSPYYHIMEPNVEFNLEYIYTVGGTKYSVQQFKMYGDAWTGQYTDSVAISLEDQSKFLKLVKPLATLYENCTVPELIWRVLDSVGFTNYNIDESDVSSNYKIPVFWTTGDMTAWEVLDDLAHATQTAVYFDAYGVLQVKTRDAAFNDTLTPSWTLYGQKNGTILTDISALAASEAFDGNNIDVKYKITKWRVGTTGEPASAAVYTPDDPTVVRSTPLRGNLTTTSTKLYLGPSYVATWPYASKVNIDGEVLSYAGKEFAYTTYTKVVTGTVVTYTTPVKHYVWVNTQDELDAYNNQTPGYYRSGNYLTGALLIKERGLWNTVNSAHNIDASGWLTQGELVNGATHNMYAPTGTFRQNIATSTVTLIGPGSAKDANDTYWVYRGATQDSSFARYGTRMRFRTDTASVTKRAGIAISVQGARNDGYYIELRPTSTISTNDADVYGEVMIYSRKNGKYATIAIGARIELLEEIWYDVDVVFAPGTGDAISVWLNGARVAGGVGTGVTKQTISGKYAMYLRGKTVAEYEYFYGVNVANQPEPEDNFGYFDLIYGGMRSGYWSREILYQLKTRSKKIGNKVVNQTYRLFDYIFDEFGPYVHEIREFDVKFDPKPVQYSSLFNTNNWYSAVLDYRSTPFGAKYIIANVARKDAILQGADSMVFNSADNTVNQVSTVLGRDLDISTEAVVNVKNIATIRSRGQIDTELSSDWLQTKDMATAVATWIAKHWSEGLDSLSVTIFGNPLIELTDIVNIDYALKKMTPSTHEYFVTGIATNFTTGLETTLTLRRVRSADNANFVITP